MTFPNPEIPSMMATLCSYERLFGPYHPQTLAMTTVLAEALCGSGQRAAGRRLLERAVGDLTRRHGRFHPVRLRALQVWFTLLCQDADWARALTVQRELADCRLNMFGPDHPEAVAARENLAAITASLLNSSVAVSA